jgi:hypothetical protein
MQYQLITLDDGRAWITDGITGIECESAIKILEILKELSDCNCEASINTGMLWLEDGTNYDLKKLIKEATK